MSDTTRERNYVSGKPAKDATEVKDSKGVVIGYSAYVGGGWVGMADSARANINPENSWKLSHYLGLNAQQDIRATVADAVQKCVDQAIADLIKRIDTEGTALRARIDAEKKDRAGIKALVETGLDEVTARAMLDAAKAKAKAEVSK